MPAPATIHQLVARFTENREAYRSGKYNEARLRQEFLDLLDSDRTTLVREW